MAFPSAEIATEANSPVLIRVELGFVLNHWCQHNGSLPKPLNRWEGCITPSAALVATGVEA